MKEKKREIEIVVISDVHLGTYGCRAEELHRYLSGIKPQVLILNGDIIDFWQFSKRYFPKYHMKVMKDIINLSVKGTSVYYITGNHDETLRKFSGTKIGNIEIVNQLELVLNGNRTWFFHGDVFDVVMQHARWLEKAGSVGYDALIVLNVLINKVYGLFGKRKISISRRIKDNVKLAVKYIGNFEKNAARLALQKGYHSIVCGHIHHPEIKEIRINENEAIGYLNSGDWVENLSALEYNLGEWTLFTSPLEQAGFGDFSEEEYSRSWIDMNDKEIFRMVMKEFQQR